MSAEYTIKENSWLAALAAHKLKTRNVAMVLGKTIHLHNATSKEFLSDKAWLKHELCHIAQFKRYGFFIFLVKYLYESAKHGYHNNRYEVEARSAESK